MNQGTVNLFLEKGFLLSPDLEVDEIMDVNLFNKIQLKDKPLVLNKEIFSLVVKNNLNVSLNWLEFERSRVMYEKEREGRVYFSFLEVLGYIENNKKAEIFKKNQEDDLHKDITEKNIKRDSSVIVLKQFKEDSGKRDVQDFVSYFKIRYETLKKFIENKNEMENTISISRISTKANKEKASLIGMIYDKHTTKNGNIILNVEDNTGSINVLITKNKKEVYDLVANTLVLDEVIGIKGVIGDKIIFADSIILPDITLEGNLKKSDDEVYAIFTGDLHVGSKMFLKDKFLRFINWMNGEIGDENQKELASKVKYLFIAGDLVDGVGIYPEQDKELVIKSVYEQYKSCIELLKKINKNIKIIICAGNHDAIRLSEPQPLFNKEFVNDLYEMENVIIVSNPGLVNIHSSENFDGFNILLYHGYSFDYYVANIDSIRNNGGYDRSDLIMKLLLQKRHLAPSHGSTLYIPYTNEDPLIINKAPDIFLSAHIHKSNVGNYNNILTISSSCWQSKTTFQEKVGHNPDPCKIPILNLKTREIKVLRFDQ